MEVQSEWSGKFETHDEKEVIGQGIIATKKQKRTEIKNDGLLSRESSNKNLNNSGNLLEADISER